MPVQNDAEIEITAYRNVPEMARGMIKDIRLRWALEEIDQPYRVRLIDGIFEDKADDYYADQPFGQVPVLKEADLTMFESGAILIHIGESDERLLPKNPVGRGRALSWLIAALNSVEPPIEAMVAVKYGGEGDWKEPALAAMRPYPQKKLARLSQALGEKEWLDGSFSIADIAMVDVLRKATALIGPHPNLVAYVERGTSRPAFKRAMEAHLHDCAVKEPQSA